MGRFRRAGGIDDEHSNAYMDIAAMGWKAQEKRKKKERLKKKNEREKERLKKKKESKKLAHVNRKSPIDRNIDGCWKV